MSTLIDVIMPVFLVLAFGNAAARTRALGEPAIDALMRFAQNFALPCLLFRGVAQLDLATVFRPGLMVGFYAGAFASFALSLAGARLLFRRPPTDAVAIAFAAMFSNTLLLGLPITERAYGSAALAGNYAIISVHSPLIYTVGIVAMEWARHRASGQSGAGLLRQVMRALLSQPLILGILAGFAVNLAGTGIPAALGEAVDLMARAAIPAALFGLGGVLHRYRPEGERGPVAMVCAASLLLHPALTWLLGTRVFGLDTPSLRSAVVTAAMPPGVNAYLFAHYYGVGQRVSASAALIGTVLSMGATWFWLGVLP